MLLVTYTYDAWGNFTVSPEGSDIAAKNPFTYRGYYYDYDLGHYDLNSRYYDSNTGRFISPDDIGYLGANGDLNSYNLYAYCSNDPGIVDPKILQYGPVMTQGPIIVKDVKIVGVK